MSRKSTFIYMPTSSDQKIEIPAVKPNRYIVKKLIFLDSIIKKNIKKKNNKTKSLGGISYASPS